MSWTTVSVYCVNVISLHRQKRHRVDASCVCFWPDASCQQVGSTLLTLSSCIKSVNIGLKCNALTTRIVQCKWTLQFATTVRYNTKQVVAFWKHALKAYGIVSDNCMRQLWAKVVQCKPPVFSATWYSQTCCKLIKQLLNITLAWSLRLAASLSTTCIALVIMKPEQAMRTQSDICLEVTDLRPVGQTSNFSNILLNVTSCVRWATYGVMTL